MVYNTVHPDFTCDEFDCRYCAGFVTPDVSQLSQSQCLPTHDVIDLTGDEDEQPGDYEGDLRDAIASDAPTLVFLDGERWALLLSTRDLFGLTWPLGPLRLSPPLPDQLAPTSP